MIKDAYENLYLLLLAMVAVRDTTPQNICSWELEERESLQMNSGLIHT